MSFRAHSKLTGRLVEVAAIEIEGPEVVVRGSDLLDEYGREMGSVSATASSVVVSDGARVVRVEFQAESRMEPIEAVTEFATPVTSAVGRTLAIEWAFESSFGNSYVALSIMRESGTGALIEAAFVQNITILREGKTVRADAPRRHRHQIP